MSLVCARLLYKTGLCHSLAEAECYRHHKGTCELVCYHGNATDCIHSDQGQNFESIVLKNTLDEFGICRTRTSAYHPQVDGIVERFNRSLLQLLHMYIDKECDWEQHLPLYPYRAAAHSTTGVSLHILMFGREPHSGGSRGSMGTIAPPLC